MIKELMEKYGLIERDEGIITFYSWIIEGTIRQGSAIRVEKQYSGELEIDAASEIMLIKHPLLGYLLQYHDWQQIELKDLEERLKYLKYSYNRELLKYKKYIMEDKMKKIEKDFV